MRDLKFRAWHKEKLEMLSVTTIDWDSELEGRDDLGFIGHKEGVSEFIEYI